MLWALLESGDLEAEHASRPQPWGKRALGQAWDLVASRNFGRWRLLFLPFPDPADAFLWICTDRAQWPHASRGPKVDLAGPALIRAQVSGRLPCARMVLFSKHLSATDAFGRTPAWVFWCLGTTSPEALCSGCHSLLGSPLSAVAKAVL